MVDIEEVLKEYRPEVDKIIEKWIPKEFNKENLEFIFGAPAFEFEVNAANEGMSKPIWDLLGRGGKRWRPILFFLTVDALGGDHEKLKDFCTIVEIVHNGTLMHDDIEDDSDLRRGKPCTHKIFGNDVAINAGDGMYYLPLVTLIKSNLTDELKVKAYEVYIQEMLNLVYGQAMDITWHKGIAGADEVNEQQYLQMTAFKTGTLARMSARLAAVLSGADEKTTKAIGKIAERIGVAFQIQDDILNLTATSGKGQFIEEYIGSDITEGKRTLMVIHTIKEANEQDRKRLIEILRMHTREKELKQEAINIIKKYDSIEYSKDVARKLVKEAWEELNPLLNDSDAKQKLKAFADYLIERDV